MKPGRHGLFALTLAALIATPTVVPSARQPRQSPASASVSSLTPTSHPRVPSDLSQLWLAPDKTAGMPPGSGQLVEGVKLLVKGDYAKALAIFSQPALQKPPLGSYAVYYAGLAQLRLDRAADARRTFHSLQGPALTGYLAEASAVSEAEADDALGDQAAAVAIYERLVNGKATAPEELLMRLGRAARAAGDTEKAARAFSRVFYEYPLSDQSPEAGSELDQLPAQEPSAPGNARYKLEFARAEQFYAAKWYPQARTSFQALRRIAADDDRELVNLRIAECDYYLKRLREAREGLRPYAEHATRQAEALFYFAVASRKLGDPVGHLRAVNRLADEFPSENWTEEALNDLATSRIISNEDEKADATFRELYEKFPMGHYGERAAWKIGWGAYKNGRFADAARVFERAAADFPRSDYRPPFLYWAARGHEALKEPALAEARYTLVATDYLNSYYGRLALRHLDGRAPQRRLVVNAAPPVSAASSEAADGPASSVALPPNQAVIRALLGAGFYDQAIDELRYAQKTGSDSSAVQATLAWIYQQQGRAETGLKQFALYRAAVNTMRRAYPQFMAAGGEGLPPDLLKVIFPLAYWDLIQKHAAAHNLDPYLVAALVAQESTFVADIKSSANAVGLMQLIPATARLYARKVQLPYSPRLLTNPDANIQMGTAYLADMVQEFGDLHLALASYNAGDRPVHRWTTERPSLASDEFIDDIPYPETQNYVKRILGTAEDYRRLYGPGAAAAEAGSDVPVAAPAASPAPKTAAVPAAAPKTTAAPARKTTKKPVPARKGKAVAQHRTQQTR